MKISLQRFYLNVELIPSHETERFSKTNETNDCNRLIGHELPVRAERDTASH